MTLPEILNSQHLVPRALAEADRLPALWLRGIPLAPLFELPSLPDEQPVLAFGTFASGTGLAEGFFATDGSGSDGTDPRLRRCGWGVAHMTSEGKVIGGIFGAQPAQQTVGRAETWALRQLLHHTPDIDEMHVVTDRQGLYRRWHKGGQHDRSPLADIWEDIEASASGRRAGICIKWVPVTAASRCSRQPVGR